MGQPAHNGMDTKCAHGWQSSKAMPLIACPPWHSPSKLPGSTAQQGQQCGCNKPHHSNTTHCVHVTTQHTTRPVLPFSRAQPGRPPHTINIRLRHWCCQPFYTKQTQTNDPSSPLRCATSTTPCPHLSRPRNRTEGGTSFKSGLGQPMVPCRAGKHRWACSAVLTLAHEAVRLHLPCIR